MPNTYAAPSPIDSAKDEARPDSAMTPASTGAQHDVAAPENTPSV